MLNPKLPLSSLIFCLYELVKKGIAVLVIWRDSVETKNNILSDLERNYGHIFS